MALQLYFPNAEAERIIWLGNYQAKIATHGAAVGLTAAGNAEHPYHPDFTASMQTGASPPGGPPHSPNTATMGCGSKAAGAEIGNSSASTKPYMDERGPLTTGSAETREYRMCWWDKGEPNGDWSPVQGVAVGA